MSLKAIIATPLFLVVAATAGAAEQTRQTTVVQDMATGPAAPGGLTGETGDAAVSIFLPAVQVSRDASREPSAQGQGQPTGAKIKNPTGGTKLPAVQKVRDAANRSQQADKHKGHIEIESFSMGAVDGAQKQRTHHAGGINVALGDGSVRNHAPKDGACVAGCSNNLKPGEGGAGGGQAPHGAGDLVGFQDGSVRNGTSPVGGNETISIGSGSTETKPGSGNDSVWMDLGTPVGRAPKAAPKGGSLGSLNGLGSIGQLAAPPGAGDAAGGQARNTTFAPVDRTSAAKHGANTGAVGGNKTQNIGIGRTETTAGGGGPSVKVFSGSNGAGAARPSSNITMKGSTIRQN